jgi:hypothetical protein
MKLPNGNAALVDLEKLEDYCLSNTHPHGKHKARVFKSVLGVTRADARDLRTALRKAANEEEAVVGITDVFGTRYVIDFTWTRGDADAVIRSSWIVLHGQIRPRFVTCFVR